MKPRRDNKESNIEENLHDLGYGDAFVDKTPKTKSLKKKENKQLITWNSL